MDYYEDIWDDEESGRFKRRRRKKRRRLPFSERTTDRDMYLLVLPASSPWPLLLCASCDPPHPHFLWGFPSVAMWSSAAACMNECRSSYTMNGKSKGIQGTLYGYIDLSRTRGRWIQSASPTNSIHEKDSRSFHFAMAESPKLHMGRRRIQT